MKTVGSRPLEIADEREASRWVREMFGRVASRWRDCLRPRRRCAYGQKNSRDRNLE